MVVVLLSVKSRCAANSPIRHCDRFQPSNGIRAVGGWWLVAGGWWLVAGGWWLVAGGWWLVAGGWWLIKPKISNVSIRFAPTLRA
jgi:hypothetical protein